MTRKNSVRMGCPAIHARQSCASWSSCSCVGGKKEEVLDDRQFDDMTRVLGRQSGRRGMLKAAAGGVLGLVGLSALTDGVMARKCKNDKDCPSSKVCHNKNCVECKSDRNCSGGSMWKKNKCVRKCQNNTDCNRNEFCGIKNASNARAIAISTRARSARTAVGASRANGAGRIRTGVLIRGFGRR